MMTPFSDPSLRGTRRTRPLALALAGSTLAGLGLLASGLVWGLARGGASSDSIELMNIDAVPAEVDISYTVAPSRPAPDFLPNAALTAQTNPAALAQIEHQLIAAANPGPELGSALPPTDIQAAPPTFDGRPLRAVRTVRMLTTAYSPDEQSCGIYADGITASGYSVWTNGMKLVAADTDHYPFGTILTIPGYNGGRPVPVLDRGGVIKGHRLDVLYPTHERALQWGAQRLDVTVWEYADQ